MSNSSGVHLLDTQRKGVFLATAALITSLCVGPAIAATTGATAVSACRAAVSQLPALPDPPVTLPPVGPLPPSPLLSPTGTRVCRGVESVLWSTAATCRTPFRELPSPPATDPCTPIDGRDISARRIADYQLSWVHQALSLQSGLDTGAPLTEEQIPHTHNSFNASSYYLPTDGTVPSYYPTLTNQDPNQVYSLTDQLNMDVRFLELDLHWVPSPFGNASTGFKWVTLCHGDSSNAVHVHIGCTDDRPLQDGLAEIRHWMDAHPDQFVFVYFENQLNGVPMAHSIAGQLIAQAFDQPSPRGAGPVPHVFKPAATAPCASMPTSLSQSAMKAAGSHLLIVGNCDPANGQATQWGTLVHDRGPLWQEGGDASAYDTATTPAPPGQPQPDGCYADSHARATDANFRRWFGDDTFVTALTSHDQNITAATTAEMVRCGVNIIGFDQLTPEDGRLAALVWSWTADQALHPSGACAVQDGATGASPGRFEGAPCDQVHPFACLLPDRTWRVTAIAGAWTQGFAACATAYPASTFSVPVNGYRNQRLLDANPGAKAWLDYRQVGGTWTPDAPAI